MILLLSVLATLSFVGVSAASAIAANNLGLSVFVVSSLRVVAEFTFNGVATGVSLLLLA